MFERNQSRIHACRHLILLVGWQARSSDINKSKMALEIVSDAANKDSSVLGSEIDGMPQALSYTSDPGSQHCHILAPQSNLD